MPSGCSMAVASPEADPGRGHAVARARRGRWPRDYNLIPIRETFIDDCETPVSAFLKLRDREPSFLLESADQGRVGRYSFIGFRPRKVLRWSLGDEGDPYALAAAELGRLRVAAAARPAAVRRRRRRAVRLRPGPHGRAARAAQPRSAWAARPGADADRRAGRVRPPQAHDHGDRERLRGRRSRRLVRARRRDDRARCGGGSPGRFRDRRGLRPATGRWRRWTRT